MVKFGPLRFNTKDVATVPKVYYDMFLKKFEPNLLGVNDFNPDANMLTSVDKKITLNKISSVLLELAKA